MFKTRVDRRPDAAIAPYAQTTLIEFEKLLVINNGAAQLGYFLARTVYTGQIIRRFQRVGRTFFTGVNITAEDNLLVVACGRTYEV